MGSKQELLRFSGTESHENEGSISGSWGELENILRELGSKQKLLEFSGAAS